jgi:hypothetical protein
MDRFLFGHTFRVKFFYDILAIIDPSNGRCIHLALKIIQFHTILSNKCCGKLFTVHLCGKREFSVLKIGAIAFGPITGAGQQQEQQHPENRISSHDTK